MVTLRILLSAPISARYLPYLPPRPSFGLANLALPPVLTPPASNFDPIQQSRGNHTMALGMLPNVLGAASGVFAHLCVFRHGEWDGAALSVFAFYLTVFAAAGLSSYLHITGIPLSVVGQIGSSHVAALYTSILLYRAFFHRLSSFPGPVLARLSNFYITALSVKKLHLYEEVQKLHTHYGDYVRVGKWPNAHLSAHFLSSSWLRTPGAFYRRPRGCQDHLRQSVSCHEGSLVHTYGAPRASFHGPRQAGACAAAQSLGSRVHYQG
jgi:hypothetical protein